MKQKAYSWICNWTNRKIKNVCESKVDSALLQYHVCMTNQNYIHKYNVNNNFFKGANFMTFGSPLVFCELFTFLICVLEGNGSQIIDELSFSLISQEKLRSETFMGIFHNIWMCEYFVFYIIYPTYNQYKCMYVEIQVFYLGDLTIQLLCLNIWKSFFHVISY